MHLSFDIVKFNGKIWSLNVLVCEKEFTVTFNEYEIKKGDARNSQRYLFYFYLT